MRDTLIAILRALEAEIPPPPKCHHAIVFAQYGGDSIGWTDHLALQINDGGTFFAYFIEDGDFDMPIESLVAEIARQHGDRKATAQEGVALGQFVA